MQRTPIIKFFPETKRISTSRKEERNRSVNTISRPGIAVQPCKFRATLNRGGRKECQFPILCLTFQLTPPPSGHTRQPLRVNPRNDRGTSPKGTRIEPFLPMPAGPFFSKRQSFSFVRDQAGGIEISFWFLGLIFKYKGYRNLPIFGSSYTHVESDCVNYCVAEGSARSRNESYLFFFYIS